MGNAVGRRRASKPKRGKKVSFQLITPDSHHGERMFCWLRQRWRMWRVGQELRRVEDAAYRERHGTRA